ncbi:MAG: MBL fold metallo-hydrolase [Candidatus Bathyarchaeota archaeon]
MRVVGNIYMYPEVGFDCNTYLIKDELTVVVDPGTNFGKLVKGLGKDGFNVKDINLIINTHSHPDHCGINKVLKESSAAKIAMHRLEIEHLNLSKKMARYLLAGLDDMDFKVDFYIEDEFLTGKLRFKIIHTPGHSPGSVCLYNEDFKVLICGDLIFNGGVGRTDFPGGDSTQLKNSIEKIARLDIQYLLPGHMDIVVGEVNVKQNFEFIRQAYFDLL